MAKNLKVGVFHPSLHLSGGAELVALMVTNTLARNGYEVILYTDKKITIDKVVPRDLIAYFEYNKNKIMNEME